MKRLGTATARPTDVVRPTANPTILKRVAVATTTKKDKREKEDKARAAKSKN